MTEVLFPQLSKEEAGAEGELSTWFVKEGETVAEDQLLAEVQVDKVSAEVPSPTSGVIHLLVGEGEAVAQGTPVARIV